MVRVTGSILGGSACDPVDKPGLSELNTVLMNGDSTQIAKVASVQHQLLKGLGKHDLLRFVSETDRVNFHTNCVSSDLAVQLRLLAHHLLRPSLTDASMETAKENLSAAIRNDQKDLDERANQLLIRSLLAKNSRFTPPEMNKKLSSIEKLTVSDINAFRTKYVVPAATTIVIAGAIDFNLAKRLVTESLKDWTSAIKPECATLVANERQVSRVALAATDTTNVRLAIGKLLPTAKNQPQFAHLMLADCVLSKHPLYSRLAKLKAQQARSSLSMSSTIRPMASKSAWILELTVPQTNALAVSNGLKEQINAFSTNGLSAQELTEAKRFLPGELAVTRLDSLYSSADTILDGITGGDTFDYWFKLPTKLESANLPDVNSFIKDAFQPDKACVVVAGDSKAIKQVSSLQAK
jgi:Predicted Zn-dependent peptidases